VTANLFGQFSLIPRDRVTLKFINNDLDTELPIRLSLTQYQANPYQHGCAAYNTADPNGGASVSLYANGFTGTKESLTASQAGLGRHDRRTIFGARWEHDITKNTTWRTQFVWDNRDIDQPTSTETDLG
jgi:iron complex outermembrane recepter protein